MSKKIETDYSLLDKLPYPILVINDKYDVIFLNASAKKEYLSDIPDNKSNIENLKYRTFQRTRFKNDSRRSGNAGAVRYIKILRLLLRSGIFTGKTHAGTRSVQNNQIML